MAARKVPLHRAWTPDKVRQRIKAGLLMKRLQDHALGELEMTKTQISAALILLRKVVPDLSAVEHTGIIRHQHANELSDAELANIAAGGSEGAAEASSSQTEPTGVH